MPALAADVALLGVFLYVALGSSLSAGSPSAAGDFGTAGLGPAAPLEGQPEALVPGPPFTIAGLGSLKTDIQSSIGAGDTQLGVVLRDTDGNVLLDVGSDQRFVLASVAKVYIMAAYLDMLRQQGTEPDHGDLILLEDMIRWSDNDSASVLWRQIGREEGLDAFLISKGLPQLNLTEGPPNWGTLYATAGEVSELLWRLANGSLLDPASTEIAIEQLANVDEDQAWGVSAGTTNAGGAVMLKNGWYPEIEGWRVNTAGIVRDPDGFHVLVILAYPTHGFQSGIELVEGIAERVNRYMSEQ